jgi:hypothetical protein
MDTSIDQSTVALDFMSGIGVNLPQPTHEQYARRIIAIGERLHKSRVLHGIITASTSASSKLSREFTLRGAMQEFLPERYEALKNARFMQVKDTSGNRGDLGHGGKGVSTYLYLGYDGVEVLWFWVEAYKYDHRSPRTDGKSGPIACIELDVASMTEIFSRFEYATPFPQHIVGWLVQHAKRERDRRREALFEFERQTTLLEVDHNLFDAIDEMPRLPGGLDLFN